MAAPRKGYKSDSTTWNLKVALAGKDSEIEATVAWQALLSYFREVTETNEDFNPIQRAAATVGRSIFDQIWEDVLKDSPFSNNIFDRMRPPVALMFQYMMEAMHSGNGEFFRSLADAIERGARKCPVEDPIRFYLMARQNDDPWTGTESGLRRETERALRGIYPPEFRIQPGPFNRICKELGIVFSK